jgi:hypothetical protein
MGITAAASCWPSFLIAAYFDVTQRSRSFFRPVAFRGPGSGPVRARKLRPRGQKSPANKPGLRKLVRVERREAPALPTMERGTKDTSAPNGAPSPRLFEGHEEGPVQRGWNYGVPGAGKEYGRWRTRFLIPPLQGERERKSAKHDRREARASGDDAGARRIRRR